MAIENREQIKTYFQTDDKPTQTEFENWMDSIKFKLDDKTDFDLLKDPSTESVSGVDEHVNEALEGLVQSVFAIQDTLNSVVSASASIKADPVPQAITTTESIMLLVEDTPSSDTSIIEVDPVNDTITVKKSGRYQFLTSLVVSNASNTTDQTFTLRTRDVSDNEIFSERFIDCPAKFTRTDFRYVQVDVAEGDLPLTLEITLQSTGPLSLENLETTLSTGSSVQASGGLAEITSASNTNIRAITIYANKVGIINTSTGSVYRFDNTNTNPDDGDIYLTPDDIIEPAPGRWVKQVQFATGSGGAPSRELVTPSTWDGTKYDVPLDGKYYQRTVNNLITSLVIGFTAQADGNTLSVDTFLRIDNRTNTSAIASITFDTTDDGDGAKIWEWADGDPLVGIPAGAVMKLRITNLSKVLVESVTVNKA